MYVYILKYVQNEVILYSKYRVKIVCSSKGKQVYFRYLYWKTRQKYWGRKL